MVRGEGGVGAPDPLVSPLRAAAWHIIQMTAADSRLAITCARRALGLNPRSVAAYQYEVLSYHELLMAGWTQNPGADAAACVEAARQAVALSPVDGLSQALLSATLALARDKDGAVATGRRALSIDPNSANTLGPVGGMLAFVGDPREADDVITRLLNVAPSHYLRSVFLSLMGLNWLRLGTPERGLPHAEEAVKLRPEVLSGHIARATLLASIGRRKDAAAALAEAFRQRADLDQALVGAMVPYSDPNDAARLAGALRTAGIEERTLLA